MKILLIISRPRFWIYVLGPYLVGLAAGAKSPDDFLRPDVTIFLFYFLLPANLLIYGINDIFDFETDSLNPKKNDYEMRLPAEAHSSLIKSILTVNIPFFIIAALFSPKILAAFSLFVFLSVFYSSPPIRAKALPLVDSAFNFLYVVPGIVAYILTSNQWPPADVLLAAGLWTAAMHAFSAVPDIDSDRRVGLLTVAVFLGRHGTIIFCLLNYSISALIMYKYLGGSTIALGSIYASLMAASIFINNEKLLFRIYSSFPWINAIAGFVIFLIAAMKNTALMGFLPFSGL